MASKKYSKHKLEIYYKYNCHCAYCGVSIGIKDMQIDHIIPQLNFFNFVSKQIYIPEFLKHLTIDDVHHLDNLNPSCRVCNLWKSTYHLELFRNEIKEQTKRLQLRSSNYRVAKLYGLIIETDIKVKFYYENCKK